METHEQDFLQMSDEALLGLAIKHPRVFEVLVDRYQKPFYWVAYRVLHSSEDAEDVVQDAFVKIYRAAHQLRKEQNSSFKKWAYTIVFRTALTRWRKQKKEMGNQEYMDNLLYHTDLAAAEPSLSDQTHTKLLVQEALERLPLDLREFIDLHYLKDFSYKDIAQQKGLSVGAVKMRLFRARNFFKKIAEKHLLS